MARRRKKEKKNRLLSKKNLVGVFIVGIMVLSGIGYMWSDKANTKENYNGHKFFQQNNNWYTQVDGQYVMFNFHPSELESINLSNSTADYLRNVKMLYITFDPDSKYIQDFEVARVRLEKDLPNLFKIYPVTGVTANSSDYRLFPIITCQNATMYVPVIYFRQGNTTELITDGSCLIVQARDSYDIPALTDRIIYSMLRIM